MQEESQVWERAYVRKTGKIKGSYQIFRWGTIWQTGHEIAQFYWKSSDPHIRTQQSYTWSWKNNKKKSKTPCCDKATTTQNKISRLALFCCLPGRWIPLLMIRSSKAHRGNVFTDRQLAWTGATEASTINRNKHKGKKTTTKQQLTNHCDTNSFLNTGVALS